MPGPIAAAGPLVGSEGVGLTVETGGSLTFTAPFANVGVPVLYLRSV
jgi:hypothetical protein